MADVIKKATREAFGEGLVALGAEMPNLVVLDADLAAATKTGMFKKAYPDRFFDCGIAEQNMIGVAAAWRPRARCRWLPPLPCLLPAGPTSRYATAWDIPI